MTDQKKLKILIVTLGFFTLSEECLAQRYLSDLDSSLLYLKDSVKPFLKRYENLRFSGYLQPQFQVAQSKGARSYAGGDFSEFSQSRFMLRRARIKLDYLIPTKDYYPKALFTFQLDATERGVNVRDMFIRLYETKRHFFSFTTGLFARPFGYELNLGSSYRETPERGRMSQILMPLSQSAVKRRLSRTKTSWTYGLPISRASSCTGAAGVDRSTTTSFAGTGGVALGSMERKP